MMGKSTTVEIPITERARKYGYVIWRKSQDEEVRALLGEADSIDLCGDIDQRGKNVDWKQRRVSITYRFTRSLPKTAKRFRLSKVGKKISLNAV